jgi:hypothetical protein
MKYLMKCGHVNNATDEEGNPICIICLGIDNGYNQVDKICEGNIGLEGRKAKCLDCQKTVDSRWDLPYFQYRPECEYDIYYNGCYGWD